MSHSKKYIFYTVLWQWIALLTQITAVFTIAQVIGKLVEKTLKTADVRSAALIFIIVLIVRFISDRMVSHSSFMACADVKRILREKIYEKMLRIGASYDQLVSSSEVVQVSTEGVEQLETYFGKYLPQLFYSLLAPVTLFIILCRISIKAGIVLLICVPLIPVSIVVVQKIAKKLLNKYWSVYTELGDSFLENLQGLTTLKIYEADQKKADEMDTESQKFRRITMKVLMMQLNSTSVMDIVAYGGAAVGMAVAVTEFIQESITLSGAICIVLLASEFFLPLRLLGSYFHIAMNGMAASDKMFNILDLAEPEDGKLELKAGQADISFENVYFSYEENRQIIKGIDFSVKAGNFISFVGKSGCGKSTIASIMTPRGELVGIEMFAHGALCMSISGKCYLSLYETNCSANRGACRQLCRRKYTVTDTETGAALDIDGRYVLSPKDLCTVDFLDRFIGAGVRVLKIEGRARGAEYVKRVVSCYDEALRAIEAGTYTPALAAGLKERLATVFNRGFWEGYYAGRPVAEHSQHYGSAATRRKVYVGKVTNFYKRISVAEVLVEAAPLSVGEEIFFMGATTGIAEQTLAELHDTDGTPAQSVAQGTLCAVHTDTPIHRGDQLYKFVDAE